MEEVQASDAKARLAEILDQVERGESVVITRHGRSIARIVPERSGRQTDIDRAIESIKSLRKRAGKMSVADILSARHEGHER